MKHRALGLLALALLYGCETLNDAVVRQMHRDWGMSRRATEQIRQGLERRREVAPDLPWELAPAFLDQG